MKKIPIDQIVIVEGKYDKITLENIIDATIIFCEGFGIFKNRALKNGLKRMARERGVIILTDSDRAGAVIRSHLQTILQGCDIYSIYTPALKGKEKRKDSPSKEGILGVEGISSEILYKLFDEFRAKPIPKEILPIDLYECGFSGQLGAKERKAKLLEQMDLPPHLSNNALLKELNRRFSKNDFYDFIKRI